MYTSLKPMRAFKLADKDIESIKYPCYGSPKYDGIRAIVFNNQVLSNTLKPIRNLCVQSLLSNCHFLDGELIAGRNFQDTTSTIMSESGGPLFTFFAFDSFFRPHDIYLNRVRDIEDIVLSQPSDDRIKIVWPIKLKTPNDLLAYELDCLQQGYEGCMIRSGTGRYKFGRSTLNEEYLLKRKPVIDEEAFVIGFEEQMENQNELTYDNRGYAQRSMHQCNKAGKATLGAFIVRSQRWGDFRIGTGLGLTDSLRKEVWNNQSKYLGQILTFKYQEFGSKDKPRQPIFLRFRHIDDALIEL